MIVGNFPKGNMCLLCNRSGDGELRLSDLLEGLGDAKHQLNASRKVLERLEKRSTPVAAPLPRLVQERQVRKAGYEAASKEVTKWQPMVKVGACLTFVIGSFVKSEGLGGF